jgi:DNA (cytosine-5)-methyltransferase 1
VSKPRLLDLFSGAGLAADGYAAAGFDVFGVDIESQPDYPYHFLQVGALTVLRSGWPEMFDVIHASPPCQSFTRAGRLRDAQGGQASAGDLLTPTLGLLISRWSHKTWVVENVEGARYGMPGAVPPAYTEHIGQQLLASLRERAA